MDNQILNYLLIISVVLCWTKRLGSMDIKKKPFNCDYCLTFWVTFGYQVYINSGNHFLQSIGIATLNAWACWMGGHLIDKVIIWRFKK